MSATQHHKKEMIPITRANNVPQRSLDQIPPEKVKTIVTDLLQLHNMGACETDGEVEQRIQQYFQLCRETSIRPGVESLSAALHIDRTTLWRWEQGQGCSRRRTDAIRAAKSMINSFIEQAALSGLANPVTLIFLAKNWMGYSDRYLFENVQQNTGSTYQGMTPDEIRKRIEQDIPVDDDYE